LSYINVTYCCDKRFLRIATQIPLKIVSLYLFFFRFQDFSTQPIISESVFHSIDRNKDGYITRGELKLASKNMTMKELGAIIDEVDRDNDGKLTMEEVKAISKLVHQSNQGGRQTLTLK
jgi:hypothetical protein